MTPYEQVQRIAARTQTDEGDVISFSEEFKNVALTPVLAYLERRIECLRGDEDIQFELEQVRKDIASLVGLNVPEVLIAYRTAQRKLHENG